MVTTVKFCLKQACAEIIHSALVSAKMTIFLRAFMPSSAKPRPKDAASRLISLNVFHLYSPILYCKRKGDFTIKHLTLLSLRQRRINVHGINQSRGNITSIRRVYSACLMHDLHAECRESVLKRIKEDHPLDSHINIRHVERENFRLSEYLILPF